ncbi:MAG: hypothetical protein EOR60_26090 [Mesorhizobium sp.]|nr:MAG: hypothetical protein EOR60_26090 [Mesorhizobium sp.]
MAITEPTIYVPLALCVAYAAWRFFAPSFFINRELARYARMDAQRESERNRLADRSGHRAVSRPAVIAIFGPKNGLRLQAATTRVC